ncbi:MAG: lysylphosphatidylglycerol synthase transmembrane domain-containing protein, partial [Balneolaceae bacterium]
MTRRIIKIILSILTAIVFIWLAFRSVDAQELWTQIQQIQLHWIPPFTLALLISHYLRAERWRLLLEDADPRPPRPTLFAGVMTGYMLNYVFPRLGEVSRPVYVARKMKTSSGNLLGTIVLERVIDLVCLIVLLVYISFSVVRKRDVISEILGTEAWVSDVYIFLPAAILIFVLIAWAGYKVLIRIEKSSRNNPPFLSKFMEGAKKFWKGLISVKNVKNWPLFGAYTLGIWIGFGVMAYLPFWM